MKSPKLVSEDFVAPAICGNLRVKETVELIESNLAVCVENEDWHKAVDANVFYDEVKRLSACGLTIDFFSVK